MESERGHVKKLEGGRWEIYHIFSKFNPKNNLKDNRKKVWNEPCSIWFKNRTRSLVEICYMCFGIRHASPSSLLVCSYFSFNSTKFCASYWSWRECPDKGTKKKRCTRCAYKNEGQGPTDPFARYQWTCAKNSLEWEYFPLWSAIGLRIVKTSAEYEILPMLRRHIFDWRVVRRHVLQKIQIAWHIVHHVLLTY